MELEKPKVVVRAAAAAKADGETPVSMVTITISALLPGWDEREKTIKAATRLTEECVKLARPELRKSGAQVVLTMARLQIGVGVANDEQLEQIGIDSKKLRNLIASVVDEWDDIIDDVEGLVS